MKNIELVVFDLAGTTVHDNRDVHRVLQSALQQHGVAITLEDANEVMGIPKPVAIDMLLRKRYQGERAISIDWIDEIHRDFVSNMISFYQHDPDVSEKPGVSETFRRLKEQRLKIVVDTGFDRQITDPLLARMGWLQQGLIDGSVTSDEVSRGRPHPDMVFRAMKLTGITDAAHVAKVGDTPSDLQEGTAAGCGYVIGITSGAFTAEALAHHPHTHLIDQLPEILPIIRS